MRRPGRYAFLSITLTAAAACADQALLPGDDALDPVAAEEAALVEALEAIANRLGVAADGTMGAMNDADEAPAFGNTVFAAAFGTATASAEITADVTTDPVVASLAPDALRVYHVMALWGRVRPSDEAFRPLTWDPALEVADGDAVRVRRTILFEGGDRVHPQEVRHIVSMSSYTGPHVDGVVAQMAVTAESSTDPGTSVDDAGFLSFRSSPFSITIPEADLPGLNFAKLLDGSGNGVMLAALRANPCPVGFLAGRWARTSEQGGVLGGLWQRANGQAEGYLAGRWGVSSTGERLFHAKVVNIQGDFIGFMSGHYANGVLEGRTIGRGGGVLALVRGRYMGEDGRGLLQGAWRQPCAVPLDS